MHFPALEIDLKTARCKHYQGETFGIHFCNVKGRIVPEMCSFCSDYSVRAKYNNIKTKVDGIEFDSKKESAKYQELKMLEKSGKIKNLERQKRFEIVPKTPGERAVFYVADFTYEIEDKKICMDVKSSITRKNSTYIIKRKLFKSIYRDWEFVES